ncbi:DUF1772 domain-containing protein [Sphaerisporangium sp. B11E5]|uniref:DUF1772 domain-containing protein n=1 Tax=Sphaerisporangium sp. B11E5 TaxID=3153563 RepID=UPI00325D27D6
MDATKRPGDPAATRRPGGGTRARSSTTPPAGAGAGATGTSATAPPGRVRAAVTGLVQGFALLASGLLAGTFAYGAVNVVPSFNAVPLDVRLTFHAAMMRMNEPVMRTAMALAIIGALALAVMSRGAPRLLAAGSAVLGVSSLLITLLGNVPLHQDIKRWAAAGAAPAGHEQVLRQWETFHGFRTATGLAAFLLIITVAVLARRTRAGADIPRWQNRSP